MSAPSRPPRILRLLCAVPLALAGLVACGDGAAGPVDIAAIAVTPEAVASVTFTADGESAVLDYVDGIWNPRSGATIEGATLLTAAEDRVFPLNAYRILTPEVIDQADPVYGFAASAPRRAEECGTGCSIEVRGVAGKIWKLSVGGRSFNDAGYYAKVEGDPRTFLITSQAVGDIITIVRGAAFEFPPTARALEADRVLEQVGQGGGTGAAPEDDPYLRQVLAAEKQQEAEAAGRSADFLTEAATSTAELVGAGQQAGGQQAGGEQARPPANEGSAEAGDPAIGTGAGQ